MILISVHSVIMIKNENEISILYYKVAY